MANFTEKAIKETFVSLLEEKQLSEITVKDIVEKCGINRNTFYYHFHDIPDLIENIVKEEAENIIRKYPSVNSMMECFDALIEFGSSRKKTIMHIYRSVNREVFERYLMELSEYFVAGYVDCLLGERVIPENIRKTIINYYKCVSFGLVIDWFNNGMKEEYAQSVKRLFELKKEFPEEAVRLLSEDNGGIS